MKIEFGGRNTWALVGLAAALGIYALASWVVLPAYDDLREQASSIADKEDQLRRYRRALAGADRYAQLLDQAKKSVAEGEGRLIRGDNPSLASVELQTIVEDAAKKLNLRLGPRSVSPAKRKDALFSEITMNLSFESTPNQMASFLAELRAAPKFVTVKTLQVAPVQVAEEAPSKGGLSKAVKAALTVSAVMLTPQVAAEVKD